MIQAKKSNIAKLTINGEEYDVYLAKSEEQKKRGYTITIIIKIKIKKIICIKKYQKIKIIKIYLICLIKVMNYLEKPMLF
jgi:cell division protein ZapA (FtsZ GTPase activity inhibitor)